MHETKSARSRRVGWGRGVCGVARLGRGADHGLRRAPSIRSLAEAKRLTRIGQTGSEPNVAYFAPYVSITVTVRLVKRDWLGRANARLRAAFH